MSFTPESKENEEVRRVCEDGPTKRVARVSDVRGSSEIFRALKNLLSSWVNEARILSIQEASGRVEVLRTPGLPRMRGQAFRTRLSQLKDPNNTFRRQSWLK